VKKRSKYSSRVCTWVNINEWGNYCRNVPLMSPDFPVENNETSSESQDVTTPKKQEPPVYVSPFVTMSRGKSSARKEYESRKSRKSFSSTPNKPDYTSPKAGAAYFTWLLDNQISRLQEVCRQWTTYKVAAFCLFCSQTSLRV
jgi:hypothetical protein